MTDKKILSNQYFNPNCCELGIYKGDGIIMPNFTLVNYVRIRSEFHCEG